MHTLSAHALHARFIKGEVSAEEIVRFFLARIEKNNQKLGAFLSVFPEKAIAKARNLDKKRANKQHLGKLAGLPVALKDNMHSLGELTTCGSKFLSNYRAVFDATVTRLVEEEDAVILGKTNLDEFAMGSSTENSAYYPTHNPWNLKCSPGGSSGGSCAAVSARLCPIAFGSDTGGSIRQPAAFCGITGFKPTYGRVSRHGLVAFGSSLDQIGPLVYSAADAALVMEVVGRHCCRDATSLPYPPDHASKIETPLRDATLGVPWKFLEGLKPDAKENFLEALEVYKTLGCKIVEVDLDILSNSIAVYYILATAEASTNLARFDGIRYGVRSPKASNLEEIFDLSRADGFGPEVKRRIMLGTYVLSSGYKDAFYKKAQKVRTLIIQKFQEAFQKCQMIVTPTSPFSAFEIGQIHDPLEMYLQDVYTVPANMAGLPAVSIPSGLCKNHRPLGLHLTGPQMHDMEVLRYAHHFQLATGYHKKIPPLFEAS